MFDKILNINFDLKFSTKITTKKPENTKTKKHDFFIRHYLFFVSSTRNNLNHLTIFLLNIFGKTFFFLLFLSQQLNAGETNEFRWYV